MSLRLRLTLKRGDFQLEAELEAPASGMTAIFGPSGCGKTSLLRAVAGLELAARGEVRMNGETWQDARRFLPPHRRRAAMVFQEAALFPHLSVRGNLTYARRRAAPAGRRLPLEEIIDLLDLAPLLERRPDTLSGGERQRVAIGRALAAAPALLLMDEPLAALDAARKAEILPFLERLHDRLALPVLYVTHSVEEVARLADHVVRMAQGRVVASGPVHALLPELDGERGPLGLIEGAVAGFDADYGLLSLEAGAQRLFLPGSARTRGQRLRLRVAARDVSVALREETDSSLLNQLPARVLAVTPHDAASMLVLLDTPAGRLPALITRRSSDALGLAPGKAVWARIKAMAID